MGTENKCKKEGDIYLCSCDSEGYAICEFFHKDRSAEIKTMSLGIILCKYIDWPDKIKTCKNTEAHKTAKGETTKTTN